MELPKILQSSADTEKLSLSVQGAAATLIPVIVLIAAGLKVSLDANDLMSLVNTILGMITLSVTLFGLGRKIFYAIKFRS